MMNHNKTMKINYVIYMYNWHITIPFNQNDRKKNNLLIDFM